MLANWWGRQYFLGSGSIENHIDLNGNSLKLTEWVRFNGKFQIMK